MSVIRVQKTKDYTVLSNHHLKNKNLSLKSKGLLSVMLSLPDNWDYSINGLVAISKEGKTSMRATIQELEENGYIQRNRTHDEKGRISYEYIVYEKPCTENLYTDNLYTDNPPQLNTKQSNTNKLNTNIIINIVEYLNEQAGTRYKPTTKKTQTLIKARLNEGFTVDDFKTVINNKVKEWKGSEWEKFLRPETLFGTKFESYLNQKLVSKRVNNNYNMEHQRDYDFDDIEKRLMEKQLGY